MSKAEGQLQEMGLKLPTPPRPVANYVPAVRTGNLVFLSGVAPRRDDGSVITGKLGKELDVADGYEAARLCALNSLANLRQEIGDLDHVRRIVKVLGMVNSTAEFADQPKVVNGFSDLVGQVFGEKGKHARSAVGMGSLPSNIAVEVEMVVEVAD